MHAIKPLLILCLGAASLALSGCAAIAGGYRIPNDAAPARSYSSIAGDIEVGLRASVRNVDTVAGDIRIGEGSRVASIDSVAGDVHLARNVSVDKSVETVAGDINIEAGCTIGGGIESVAGDMRIESSLVKGDVTLRAGDLELDRSRIGGVVRVKHVRDKDAEKNPPRITIGPESAVTEIVVDERAVARLRIHRSARVGKVSGATAEYYD